MRLRITNFSAKSPDDDHRFSFESAGALECDNDKLETVAASCCVRCARIVLVGCALSFARYSELGMMCEWLPIGHFNLIIHGVYYERSSASVGSPVPTRAGE